MNSDSALLKFGLRRRDQASRTNGEGWQPMPLTGASRTRRFFDLQAGTVWRDLAQLIPMVRGHLVDAGCGGQPYRALIATGVRYTGIDGGSASSLFGYETPDTTYYDGVTWPVSDNAADAVLATETLEHVREPAAFLAEAWRVLRPGGQVIMTTPFSARWHYIPEDYWRFTPSGLRALLEKTGFTDIRIFARGNAVTVASYKCLGVLTPFLLPQARNVTVRFLLRVVGLVIFPLFVGLACVGNLSLLGRGGDDCLGYTILALKSSGEPDT